MPILDVRRCWGRGLFFVHYLIFKSSGRIFTAAITIPARAAIKAVIIATLLVGLQARVAQVKCGGAGVGRGCANVEGRFEISDADERR